MKVVVAPFPKPDRKWKCVGIDCLLLISLLPARGKHNHSFFDASHRGRVRALVANNGWERSLGLC